jgi:hypothetical protein
MAYEVVAGDRGVTTTQRKRMREVPRERRKREGKK